MVVVRRHDNGLRALQRRGHRSEQNVRGGDAAEAFRNGNPLRGDRLPRLPRGLLLVCLREARHACHDVFPAQLPSLEFQRHRHRNRVSPIRQHQRPHLEPRRRGLCKQRVDARGRAPHGRDRGEAQGLREPRGAAEGAAEQKRRRRVRGALAARVRVVAEHERLDGGVVLDDGPRVRVTRLGMDQQNPLGAQPPQVLQLVHPPPKIRQHPLPGLRLPLHRIAHLLIKLLRLVPQTHHDLPPHARLLPPEIIPPPRALRRGDTKPAKPQRLAIQPHLPHPRILAPKRRVLPNPEPDPRDPRRHPRAAQTHVHRLHRHLLHEPLPRHRRLRPLQLPMHRQKAPRMPRHRDVQSRLRREVRRAVRPRETAHYRAARVRRRVAKPQRVVQKLRGKPKEAHALRVRHPGPHAPP
mmetsp:Transcript_5474/g.14296  ORF Transcript_5474/g.14296 Transcript_5474/m.14296 type:complete len:409 (-) Transcript_5474:46-1272(-)